jgi:hypothetical protein
MRLFSIIFFFILTAPLTAFTQHGNDWLLVKLKNADTVLLVSHEVTAGILLVDSAGNRIPLPKLLVGGRPNYSIVKEQQVLSGAQLDTFIKIFARPFQSRTIEMAKCYMPHHAVFLIKNGNTSYVDICFGCHRFETSKDMQRLYAFDNRKWIELEEFFMKLGFRYQLADE